MAAVAFPGASTCEAGRHMREAWSQLPRPGSTQPPAGRRPRPGTCTGGWNPPHRWGLLGTRPPPPPPSRSPAHKPRALHPTSWMSFMCVCLIPCFTPVPCPPLGKTGAPRGRMEPAAQRSPTPGQGRCPGAPPTPSHHESRVQGAAGAGPPVFTSSPLNPRSPSGPWAGAALTCPEWPPSLETKLTLNRLTGLGRPSQNTRAES